MFLRELIQTRLNSSFKIFDRQGNLIPETQIRSEYNSIKQYLLDFYSHKNECVVIKLTKDYRYLLCMLACMEVGIPYIPLKQDYLKDRLDQIREDSSFTLIIDDLSIHEIINYKEKIKQTLPNLSPEDTVYVIFTSGSTGRPKGVVIQRQGLENFFKFLCENFNNISSDDKLLQMTEFSFDLSVLDIGMFVVKNVALYFSNFENNIFKLGFEIENKRISLLNTVPNNLNMFLSDLVAERMDYTCLRTLFLGGARFSYGLYEKCKKYFTRDVNIYNFYGPTEATVYSHVKHITYEESLDCIDGVISIGKCLTNVKAHIMNEGKIADPYQKGELYIGGVQLLKEYINNPEQTSRALVHFDGELYYKSGDMAFRSEKNEFFIIGRADETIKYRGFRINLLDIDSYITRLNDIEDSVTIAIPNEATENQTICFLIMKEKKSIKEIKQEMSQLLLDYQIPEKIVFVEKYPTNMSGKVCRRTLREQYVESLNKAFV